MFQFLRRGSAIIDVGSVLCERARQFIQWPTGPEIRQKEQEFRQIKGFPGAIGAIDCYQVQISAPHDHPDTYFNRKGYYSINVQAICDANMKFTDIYAACPGSVNDARV